MSEEAQAFDIWYKALYYIRDLQIKALGSKMAPLRGSLVLHRPI